jgi:lysophospholipase L1-like esterase
MKAIKISLSVILAVEQMMLKNVAALFCLLIGARLSAQRSPATAPTPALNLQQQLERDQRIIHDYGNLARYHDEDLKVGPPAAGENRVVFMGDSITDNWGHRVGSFFPGKPYINRGISGQVTSQMLLRFRPDVINLQPKVVLILAGTNDIGGSLGPAPDDVIEGNLMSMAELSRAHNIRVVLASLLPVCDSLQPQSAKRPPARIAEINDWIKRYAADQHLVYLDYYSHMVEDKGMLRSDLTVDCLHPNAAGYDIMAPLAEDAIKKALQ